MVLISRPTLSKDLQQYHCNSKYMKQKKFPVSTRRRFDVHTASITLKRRRTDVKTTSCAYWIITKNNKKFQLSFYIYKTEHKKVRTS